MKEKERIIMDSAIRLFASKGFDSTSIQEIANTAGISKGAFYLHFKSKEGLLLEIFKYNYEKIKIKIDNLKRLDLPARELFVEHLVCQFEAFLEQKDFIIMQTREHAIPFNESIGTTIKKMRAEAADNIRTTVSSVYGSRIDRYAWDLTLLIQGMIHSYFELLLFMGLKLDLHELARYILRRTDDLAEGLMGADEAPLFKPDVLQELSQFHFPAAQIGREDLIGAIRSAREDFKESEDILISLDVIESEIQQKTPRMPVITGMLSNLNEEKELASLIRKIKGYYSL
ncbi:TetR/AcrR family transcriptional regulator [Peribacillus sp. SCS-37]|uniref:TetR/AcrR family transcriptional regulator n=1 Tax=Paraperibacillus esterisolvens TaxID=3115296 RepID=UPI003905DC12